MARLGGIEWEWAREREGMLLACCAAISKTSSNDTNESSFLISSFSQTPCMEGLHILLASWGCLGASSAAITNFSATSTSNVAITVRPTTY
jgi:hypothetical protein